METRTELTQKEQDFLNLVEAYTFVIETNRVFTFEAFAKKIESIYSMHLPKNHAVYEFLIHNRGTIKKNRLGHSTLKCSFPLRFDKKVI